MTDGQLLDFRQAYLNETKIQEKRHGSLPAASHIRAFFDPIKSEKFVGVSILDHALLDHAPAD
jgi:hypothetical protein